jgi:alpha-tubulin suppressor-like RCC1 family protein
MWFHLCRRLSFTFSSLLLVAALGCRDDGAAPTSPESQAVPATGALTATLSFKQVSAGLRHTCGVTTGDKAYCWGDNGEGGPLGGQLGDGTTIDRLTPVPVAGGLSFRQVSAGIDHSCGVTADDRAYCWGRNDYGQLGDGTTNTALTPVAVAGGRRFRQISVAEHHSCAVTTIDVAFCWGSNHFNVLGTGGGDSFVPARVAGGLKFRNVSAGFSHTCGATTDNRGYCWGNNSNYQIGDGTSTNFSRPKPVAVAGGLSFRRLFVGSGYISPAGDPSPDDALSCGVTTTNRAYCWGSGAGGNPFGSSTPAEVAGDRRYTTVSAGTQGCGVTLAGGLYCWGHSAPVRVPAGGLRFLGVSVSGIGSYACAVSTDNRAYCWGENSQGQLGDGSTNPRAKPVAVAGVM